MKLRSLSVENFRNYSKYTYNFDPDKNFTILAGPNGIGKTNFLEAIYVLSLGRSFRSLRRDDLIEWQKEYTRCSAAVVDKAGDDLKLEFFYSAAPVLRKNFKKNGVNLKNSEYLGNLLTVLFQPEDLNMLYLSPSLRRRYLDIVLCQTDKNYLHALINYRKVLKQRNALLKAILKATYDGKNIEALKEDLQAWDQELAVFGAEITQKRLLFVKFLNDRLTAAYDSIAGSRDQIEAKYEGRIIGKNYLDELFNRRSRDIHRAQTTAGPHRDDLAFFLNEKECASFASRGEIRTLILALKLVEIEYIKEKTGQNPVLLLDDVFSELDGRRQKHLLDAIHGCQTIITTTDSASVEKIAKESAHIRFVKQ